MFTFVLFGCIHISILFDISFLHVFHLVSSFLELFFFCFLNITMVLLFTIQYGPKCKVQDLIIVYLDVSFHTYSICIHTRLSLMCLLSFMFFYYLVVSLNFLISFQFHRIFFCFVKCLSSFTYFIFVFYTKIPCNVLNVLNFLWVSKRKKEFYTKQI